VGVLPVGSRASLGSASSWAAVVVVCGAASLRGSGTVLCHGNTGGLWSLPEQVWSHSEQKRIPLVCFNDAA